jgi:hypothetical protein
MMGSRIGSPTSPQPGSSGVAAARTRLVTIEQMEAASRLRHRASRKKDRARSESQVRRAKSEERWEKLKRLGTDWLERAIDRAREPVDSTRHSE